MLINRTISDDKSIVSVYESSNIRLSSYKNNNLTIFFNNGTSYTYHDVDEIDFTIFETADSQGKVLNSRIKRDREFTKNPNYVESDVNLLIEDINNNYREELLNELKTNINNLVTNNTYTTSELNNLKQLIEVYIK